MITRFANWSEILAAEIDSRRGQVFVRGRTDCARTVADLVKAICGVDPMGADWRRAYFSDKDARRIIQSVNGDLLPLFRRQLNAAGFVEIDPAYAQRGDIAYFHLGEKHQGAALFYGSGLLTPDKIGFRVLPRSSASVAWKV